MIPYATGYPLNSRDRGRVAYTRELAQMMASDGAWLMVYYYGGAA